jgi:hypothetical protein
MAAPPRWPLTALRYLAPLLLILLVAQYLVGLWTNLYAPVAGFTSQSSFPALDAHYDLGYSLGLLALIAVICAAVARVRPLIVLAALTFLGVLAAGIAGGAFVRTTPNPSTASFVMGAMFLLAFVGSLGLLYRTWMLEGRSRDPALSAPAAA